MEAEKWKKGERNISSPTLSKTTSERGTKKRQNTSSTYSHDSIEDSDDSDVLFCCILSRVVYSNFSLSQ